MKLKQGYKIMKKQTNSLAIALLTDELNKKDRQVKILAQSVIDQQASIDLLNSNLIHLSEQVQTLSGLLIQSNQSLNDSDMSTSRNTHAKSHSVNKIKAGKVSIGSVLRGGHSDTDMLKQQQEQMNS